MKWGSVMSIRGLLIMLRALIFVVALSGATAFGQGRPGESCSNDTTDQRCATGLTCLPSGVCSQSRELTDPISREVCTAVNGALFEDATQGRPGYTSGGGLAAAAGATVSIERGIAYGTENFGCYVTACIGASSNLSVTGFFAEGFYGKFEDIQGFSKVIGGSGGTPFAEVGMSAGTIHNTRGRVIGTTVAVSGGLSLLPADVGTMYCATELIGEGDYTAILDISTEEGRRRAEEARDAMIYGERLEAYEASPLLARVLTSDGVTFSNVVRIDTDFDSFVRVNDPDTDESGRWFSLSYTLEDAEPRFREYEEQSRMLGALTLWPVFADDEERPSIDVGVATIDMENMKISWSGHGGHNEIRRAFRVGPGPSPFFCSKGDCPDGAMASSWEPGVRYSARQGMVLDRANPKVCQQLCDEDEMCTAWTYRHPETYKDKPECWMSEDPTPLRRFGEKVVGGRKHVTAYEKCGFKGKRFGAKAGLYGPTALDSFGMGENNVSSFKVPPGFGITIFEKPRFRGDSVQFSDSEYCLETENFDDRLSSFQIVPSPVKTAALYQSVIEVEDGCDNRIANRSPVQTRPVRLGPGGYNKAFLDTNKPPKGYHILQVAHGQMVTVTGTRSDGVERRRQFPNAGTYCLSKELGGSVGDPVTLKSVFVKEKGRLSSMLAGSWADYSWMSSTPDKTRLNKNGWYVVRAEVQGQKPFIKSGYRRWFHGDYGNMLEKSRSAENIILETADGVTEIELELRKQKANFRRGPKAGQSWSLSGSWAVKRDRMTKRNVTGRNIRKTDGGGTRFWQIDRRTWSQVGVGTYLERGRDSCRVYLEDQKRNLEVIIDACKKKVFKGNRLAPGEVLIDFKVGETWRIYSR